MRICFVCLGNIVRSPLAENLFRQLIEEREIEGEYEVDSAGTSAFHVGEVPDGRMRSVARERGLFYSGKARQFTKNDFDNFDLILAMDRENKEVLTSLAATEHQRQKIRLLREYDPVADGKLDVPDPYYGGLDGFQNVYDLVERSILGLLEALERDRDS